MSCRAQEFEEERDERRDVLKGVIRARRERECKSNSRKRMLWGCLVLWKPTHKIGLSSRVHVQLSVLKGESHPPSHCPTLGEC